MRPSLIPILARLTLGVSALLTAFLAPFILYGLAALYDHWVGADWHRRVWVKGVHIRVNVLEREAPAPVRRAIEA